jgi:hypothetical protein
MCQAASRAASKPSLRQSHQVRHFFWRFSKRTIFTEGDVMRARHVIAVVAILFGVGVKLTSFADLTAEAAARSKTKASVDVSQMHQNMKPSGEQP